MKQGLEASSGTSQFARHGREKAVAPVRDTSARKEADVSHEFVQVAARLRFALGPHERVIAFTGVKPADGSDIVTSKVGFALARMSEDPVLVIEGPLRGAGLTSRRGIPSTPGLCDVIAGTAEIAGAMVPTQSANCFLMPLGAMRVSQAISMVASPQTREMFAVLAHRFSYVCIDVGAIPSSALGLLLSKYSDGVVLALAAGISRRAEAEIVRCEMKMAGVKLLGAVLTCRK